MDAPTLELMSALASLFESGKYADLTIVCGAKRYSVHRALLATRSTFFEGACRSGFREAESGIIDLTEEDAEAVDHMVHYFYHNDYLTRSMSRWSSRRSSLSNSPISMRPMKRPTPKKLNFALLEDPLLAQANATNTAPITAPAGEPEFQNLDLSSKNSDMPTTDNITDDDTESVGSEPESEIESSHLITHAKVYAIAEKYGITGLKALSRQKFADQIDLHMSSPDFAEACQEAYESTYHTDRGLRDVIIQAFRSNPDLSLRPDVGMAVRETPGLAWELYQMASGLPVTS
ncbi:hypothetical protein IAQ61_006678 [Plenodomus lingam]|uniref:BTB domain-containing protein n=1 Tax=Leptosphaeria maculans (strain JN3 / isolate v23.1.3 / race Av1-4-5-6-7-8) TaxID=985895 RepID=E5AC88_LEPMJ|nr:hypothetical protein LEMA_P008770.1 [Plenodomus lingam JN3]KAH9869472.1 hypothetical protein IAQ61_006678 [Plenodomus lingam]CBY02090.1 hypothetical protein LEMA_P008770.1 [Plenodomus lingam JN3]